jgi:outer membrane phospholipase A
MLRAVLFAFGLTMVSLAALAQGSDSRSTNDVTGLKPGSGARFAQHEDSFALWHGMENKGWTRRDQQAVRARYSFKYTLCGQQLARAGAAATGAKDTDSPSPCPTSGWLYKSELFLAYTGEFDFYAGTRPSGPVINRVSMPGLYLRLPASFLGGEWDAADGLEIGFAHRSNGQVTPTSSPRDARIAQEQYTAGNFQYFDTISRGANLFSLAAEKVNLLDCKCLSLRAKLRLYVGNQESAVSWGPRANAVSRFSQYDRFEFNTHYRINQSHVVDLQWRLGDRGLATDSFALGWEWTLGGVPLYLRVHRGPMNTLSNYTQRQDSLGLGLRFARL